MSGTSNEVSFVLCMFCIHLRDAGSPFPRKCKAFPDGIPKEIWPDDLGEKSFDHRKPFKGDGGIQFKVKKTKESLVKEIFGVVK